MADLDPTLGQEILDVTQRQPAPAVHHHDQTDQSGELLKYRDGLLIAEATTARDGPKTWSGVDRWKCGPGQVSRTVGRAHLANHPAVRIAQRSLLRASQHAALIDELAERDR
jgi:hypothetical protein